MDEGELTDDRTAVLLGDRVMGLAHRLRRASTLALEPLGLTPSLSRALRTVARADGPLRMTDLAERLGIVPRSATSLVDGLVDLGLVERRTDPGNRRSVLVSLSEQGAQVQDRISAARREAAARIFSTLPASDAASLLSLLNALDEANPGDCPGPVRPS